MYFKWHGIIYVVWSQLFTWSADQFISWHASYLENCANACLTHVIGVINPLLPSPLAVAGTVELLTPPRPVPLNLNSWKCDISTRNCNFSITVPSFAGIMSGSSSPAAGSIGIGISTKHTSSFNETKSIVITRYQNKCTELLIQPVKFSESDANSQPASLWGNNSISFFSNELASLNCSLASHKISVEIIITINLTNLPAGVTSLPPRTLALCQVNQVHCW